MDDEQVPYLDRIVDTLAELTTSERTTALTHLFNLRIAAVEDLSDIGDDQKHWNSVLDSSCQPDNVRVLVRELTQLTHEELAIVGARVTERSKVTHQQVLQTADDKERAKLQAQLAASAKQARESYVAARKGLDVQHKTILAEKMKGIRDAIEQGINANQDVTTLEEIFARIEQDFWQDYSESSTDPQIKMEER